MYILHIACNSSFTGRALGEREEQSKGRPLKIDLSTIALLRYVSYLFHHKSTDDDDINVQIVKINNMIVIQSFL